MDVSSIRIITPWIGPVLILCQEYFIEQTDKKLNAPSHLTGLQGLSQNAAEGLWTNKGAVTVCFEH